MRTIILQDSNKDAKSVALFYSIVQALEKLQEQGYNDLSDVKVILSSSSTVNRTDDVEIPNELLLEFGGGVKNPKP